MEQSFLSSLMSNPYTLLIAFLLTAIGAAPGVARIFRFMKSYGTALFQWALNRNLNNIVASAIDYNDFSKSESDIVMIYNTARIAEMILKLTQFVLNLILSIHFINLGLIPFIYDQSWQIISIPFLIFGIINVIEIWLIRFKIYVFRRALPEVRRKLEALQ
jgi:ABC-type thiamine transport system substrate-binding protein